MNPPLSEFGTRYRIRTCVCGIKARRLNHWTKRAWFSVAVDWHRSPDLNRDRTVLETGMRPLQHSDVLSWPPAIECGGQGGRTRTDDLQNPSLAGYQLPYALAGAWVRSIVFAGSAHQMLSKFVRPKSAWRHMAVSLGINRYHSVVMQWWGKTPCETTATVYLPTHGRKTPPASQQHARTIVKKNAGASPAVCPERMQGAGAVFGSASEKGSLCGLRVTVKDIYRGWIKAVGT